VKALHLFAAIALWITPAIVRAADLPVSYTIDEKALKVSGATSSAHAADVVVTACSQEVPAGATAVLDADLNCIGASTAVFLDDGASLDLQGHLLYAGIDGVLCGTPDDCARSATCKRGSCTVMNGTIRGGPAFGPSAALRGDRLTAIGVTFTENGEFALVGRRITLTDVIIDRPVLAPLAARGRVSATNVQVLGPTSGSFFSRTRIDMVNSYSESTVEARTVHLVSSTVTLAPGGVIAWRARLENSTVRGNNRLACFECADLVTSRRPLLDATSFCEHSLRRSGGTWGVCSLD